MPLPCFDIDLPLSPGPFPFTHRITNWAVDPRYFLVVEAPAQQMPAVRVRYACGCLVSHKDETQYLQYLRGCGDDRCSVVQVSRQREEQG